MTYEQLLESFGLYGKITEEHANQILALLKKYARVEPCKFCAPKN